MTIVINKIIIINSNIDINIVSFVPRLRLSNRLNMFSIIFIDLTIRAVIVMFKQIIVMYI